MLAACAGLVLVGRCTPRALPVLLAVILIGWVSYGTVAYWSGHMKTIFGDVGSPRRQRLLQRVSSRVIGTPVHQLADKSRIGLAALMVAAAAAGLVRRWLGGIADRVLLVSCWSRRSRWPDCRTTAARSRCGSTCSRCRPPPCSRPACSSRGRRGQTRLQRSRLIGGGPRSLRPRARSDDAEEVTGTVDRPGGAGRRSWRSSPPGCVAIGLAEVFLLARYGNEAFEQTPAGEYAAMNYIYDHDGQRDGRALDQPPVRASTRRRRCRGSTATSTRSSSSRTTRRATRADVTGTVDRLRGLGRGAFLITTRTESTFIAPDRRLPDRAGSRSSGRRCRRAPRLRLVFANKVAAVYQARLPASAPEVQPPDLITSPTKYTIWGPVGLGLLIAALLLLTRASSSGSACRPGAGCSSRWRSPRCPCSCCSCFAVAERFVMMS